MTGSLRAIETVYHGYRFRSRLEARWAVFFDTLGIPWEYEKEGYDLGKGLWYLPDFWLPQQQCWVEIKPEYSGDTSVDNVKCALLAEQSQHEVFMFHHTDFQQMQWIQDHCDWIGMRARIFWPEHYDDEGDFGAEWVACAACREARVVQPFLGIWQSHHWSKHLSDVHQVFDHLEPHVDRFHSRIVTAYLAARQARFEFGARG